MNKVKYLNIIWFILSLDLFMASCSEISYLATTPEYKENNLGDFLEGMTTGNILRFI